MRTAHCTQKESFQLGPLNPSHLRPLTREDIDLHLRTGAHEGRRSPFFVFKSHEVVSPLGLPMTLGRYNWFMWVPPRSPPVSTFPGGVVRGSTSVYLSTLITDPCRKDTYQWYVPLPFLNRPKKNICDEPTWSYIRSHLHTELSIPVHKENQLDRQDYRTPKEKSEWRFIKFTEVPDRPTKNKNKTKTERNETKQNQTFSRSDPCYPDTTYERVTLERVVP